MNMIICKFKLISESCHSSMLPDKNIQRQALAGIQGKPVDISLWMPDESTQA